MSNTAYHIDYEERISISFFFFLIWTFVLLARPQDYLLFLVPMRPALLCTGLTVFSMILERPRFPNNFSKSPSVKLIILFYLVMIVGIPFAVHQRAAFEFVITTLPKTLLYFLILIILVSSVRRLNTTIFVAFGSALFSALFYVKNAVQAAGLGARFYASQTYDPNDIAMVFASCLPFSIYFIFSKGIFKKAISLTAAVLMVVGIMMSQSRGGVLALGVVLCGLFFFKTPKWRGAIKVVIVFTLALVFINYFGVVKERFSNIKNDYNLTDEEGRLGIWKQNLDILSKQPLLGVGGGCSAIALGFYRAERDGSQKWQVTHSSVIQVAVETGIIGFIFYIILNISSAVWVRAVRKDKDNPLSLIAFFVELSFYGFWASALFLSHGYSIIIFFLLGIMAAIRNLDTGFKLKQENVGT